MRPVVATIDWMESTAKEYGSDLKFCDGRDGHEMGWFIETPFLEDKKLLSIFITKDRFLEKLVERQQQCAKQLGKPDHRKVIYHKNMKKNLQINQVPTRVLSSHAPAKVWKAIEPRPIELEMIR